MFRNRVIFESENDFSLCLKQSFPRLKTTKLRRKQWCILRSLIGKPRRCSDAFFREERLMLEEKRQKIRLIQQRKVNEKELIDFKDLPQEIPLTLSIGHRVYSHISYPEEGVFLGTIAAIDPCDHTYRVVFDRATIGSQTVNDYEIKSLTPIQTIPIKAYLQTYRPKLTPNTNTLTNNSSSSSSLAMLTPHKSVVSSLLTPNTQNMLLDDLNSINFNNPIFSASLLLQSDPMIGIGSSPFKLDCLSGFNSQFQTPLVNNSGIISNTTATTPNNGMLGGFPIRLLVMITRLNKILNVKREYITKLSGLNTEAEKLRANNETITKEFQKNYAILVLDLEKLNKDLSDYLTGVQRYCEELMAPGEFNKLLLANTTNTTNKLIQRQNSAEIIFDSHLKFEDLKQNLLNESISLINRLNIKSIDQLETNMNSINLNDNNSTIITSDNDKKIKSKNLIQLIIKLTNLLFQIREYTNATHRGSSSNNNQQQQQQSSTFLPNCTRLINDSINEIKTSLSSESKINLFVDKVQVHINHIQSTLCHFNKLNAFKLNSDNNNETLINDSFTDEYEDYEQTNQFNEEEEEEEDEENEEENQHLNESDSDNSYKTSNSNENLFKYFSNNNNNKHKLKTVSKSKLKRKRLDNSNKNINSSNNNNTKEKTHLVNYQQVLLSSPSSSSSSSSSSFHSSKTVNASLNSSNSSKNNTNNNSSKKLHIGIST